MCRVPTDSRTDSMNQGVGDFAVLPYMYWALRSERGQYLPAAAAAMPYSTSAWRVFV